MAEISVRLPKPKYGQIVVLQKNGDEPRGHGFPLTSTTCVVGRCLKSDIRITSADVSDTHCKFLIDEVSGEASLEIHGNETEVNGTHFEAVSLIKLNHKDVVLVGGRKLRFEYLPPDYKPLLNKPVAEPTDSFSAEVVDLEENGDVVDSNEREEDVVPEVPCTPSHKRVSFGPYLSPEQFDNTLPPATPIKKGATPRRSTRYSGLKFTRAPIDPLIEEEGNLETPADEKLVTNEKECVDETVISEDAEASVSSVTSVDETSVLDKTSPSLAEATEFPEISARANLDMSSIDAMSTMSDVSNIAVVPSECCSFLDEPIEEGDFEVVEQEDTSLFDDDLIGAEIPVQEITTPHLTNGTNLLRSFTTSSLAETMGEEEEEGITLSPEDMSGGINGHSATVESAAQLEEAEKESVVVESPQADYTDVRGAKELLQTPKPNPATPKADFSDVEEVKQLLKTPKNAVTSPQSPKVNNRDVEGVKDLEKTPKLVAPDVDDDLPKDVVPALEPVAQVEAVCGVSVEKLIETPESSPSRKSPEIANSPQADSAVQESMGELSKTLGVQAPETPKVDDSVPEDVDRLLQTPKTLSDDSKLNCTDLEGVARLLETPKTTRSVVVAAAAVGKTPEADYTDVRGIKKLLQTPKPPPNTPKADYRDVRGVKRLLATPKATPGTPKADYTDVEGVDLLMKTPKAKDDMKESDEKEVPEKILEESTPEAPIEIANSTDNIVDPKVDEDQPLTSEKEEIPLKEDEAETKVTEPRRGHRVSRTPKTKTPNIPSKRTASPSDPEEQKVESSVEEIKNCPSDELAEVPTGDESEESAKIPSEIEQQVEEEELVAASAPKRGRRAATSKTNTPKADYRDVSGVKRLLRTPKAMPGTPKADYSDVEGVDLLMKTPKPKDPVPQSEEEEKNGVVVEEEVPEKIVVETASEADLQSSESTEEPVSDVVESVEEIAATAPQTDMAQPVVEEEPVEKETNPPKRGRRAAAAKVDTPKADYRNVAGVKRLLRTPKAMPGTPKADYSDVEGVDLLMKTPKPKDPVPQSEEEEKNVAFVEEEVPEKPVVESTSEASEPIEESASDVVESVEVNTLVASQMDEEKPVVEEEMKEEEPEVPLPKRGRRAAAAKADTPKADYRNVAGVKRLLRTPKAMPGTPKADYSDVEGVDLLMKTPNVIPQVEEEEEKNVAVIEEEEVPEKLVVEFTPEAQTSEPIEEPVSDVVESVEVNTLVSSQMDEEKPVVEEEIQEEEPEAPLPKRGRRAATAKTNTPKLDYRDVRAVEKLMKTSVAAPVTLKVDCTDVEGDELLTKAPETKDVESECEVAEESSKNPVEKTSTEAAPEDKTETTDELANEEEEKTKESEVEKDAVPARRSRRAVPTPKTNTPKPVSRSKRKQPQSEPEIQPEVNETVDAPLLPTTEKEEPAVVEEAPSEETSQKAEEVPVKSVSTPKRGRRAAAAPASKVETPKATRSTRVKKQSESESVQAEAESRPVRSRRRKDDLLNDEKLSLSPVVRLCQIEVPQVSTSSHDMDKEENKRVSSSSNEEVAPAAVKAVGRGRGRAQPIKKTAPRRGKAAEAPVPDVVEPVPSADEMEEVEAKPAKKTTRRAASKPAVEKVEGAPEVKRRRGGSKPAAGLDDVEMLHEGKGHAADIHAHHMPDDLLQEANEESPATTSSGRPTRGRRALKVHFDVAGAVASPVRSTRSTRKTTAATASSPPDKTVSVLLERDPDIDTLAAVAAANEGEEKVPTSTATKRPRQKKVTAAAAVVAEETEDKESPAAPAVKRSRGGKKVSTDSDVPKVENSSPPPAAPSPRRTRRTRNI